MELTCDLCGIPARDALGALRQMCMEAASVCRFLLCTGFRLDRLFVVNATNRVGHDLPCAR